MNTIKSKDSNTTITVDYDNHNNCVEIHVGNETGFKFVNLTREKTEHLIFLLTEFNNDII